MNDDTVGGGSFRGVRRWRTKLRASLLIVEGVAYGSNNRERNYARRLGRQTCSLATKEALVLCIVSGGRGRGSISGGGRSCIRVDSSGLCRGARHGFYGYNKRK